MEDSWRATGAVTRMDTLKSGWTHYVYYTGNQPDSSHHRTTGRKLGSHV